MGPGSLQYIQYIILQDKGCYSRPSTFSPSLKSGRDEISEMARKIRDNHHEIIPFIHWRKSDQP